MSGRHRLPSPDLRARAADLRAALGRLYDRLWRYYDYDRYYIRETKADVRADPKASVGPPELFEEMQQWQFEHLRTQGLAPDDRVLDVGCGVLRGGIPLIEFLEPGHYYGMDISADALAVAREEVRRHDLGHKQPTLVNNDDLQFDDPAFNDVAFDVVWAQSVITHLPDRKVRELLANVGSVLAPDGVFHATIWETDEADVEVGLNLYDYWYSLSYLDELAGRHGLTVARVDADHPNGLQAIRVERSD